MINRRRQLAFRMLQVTPIKDGIAERLPDVFKKFQKELFETLPKPVHYEVNPNRWERCEKTGIVTPVQNVPIPTMYPKEMHNVLLGGEMVIRGFAKRKPMARRVPTFYIPNLKRTVVYSEILNKHFSVIATRRLILQIHEHKGFDNYLLENKACDLRTNLALKFKKSILTALLNKRLPYDEKANAELYEKYKQFIISKEELEWYGLTLEEAIRKQKDLEDTERRNVSPLKEKYRMELLQELQKASTISASESNESKDASWLSKIKSPFSSKTS